MARVHPHQLLVCQSTALHDGHSLQCQMPPGHPGWHRHYDGCQEIKWWTQGENYE